MKVMIGSIIIVILICIGIWLMLAPSFKKVGETAEKIKSKFEEDENGGKK
ncbi:hypothetical protein JOC78_000806 [Bacillus ectoiniformans]|nr:hypothetical protein [Bacillus ectoiniformans]MBM7647866.1 hypothetical protein [Bacillus ectoiniformans]